MKDRALWSCLFVLSFGCGDSAATGGGDTGGAGAGSSTGGEGTGASAGSSNDGGSSTGGSSGDGGQATGGAPPCTAETLAEAVRTTSVTVSGSSSARAMTAEAGSGSVVAWEASDGVHALRLDAVDEPFGTEITIAATRLYGVAATETTAAFLVARAPDYMTFVLVGADGQETVATNLVGGGNHNQEGVEWFGEFAQTGRLVRRADGTYAAYHALHRRWPDGIGHQGDTLRFLDAQGAPIGGGWGWGCSHSLDQRLADGPNGVVPICISDCYPTPAGIFFNHDAAQITGDPNANCAGGYSTGLGGLVATAAGFFLVYQDAQGGAHLGSYGPGGATLADLPLSVPGSSRLARYADGLLLGSGATQLQRLDASGAALGEPASITAPLPEQDLESRSNGEVAWATASGTSLSVVRVRVCD